VLRPTDAFSRAARSLFRAAPRACLTESLTNTHVQVSCCATLERDVFLSLLSSGAAMSGARPEPIFGSVVIAGVGLIGGSVALGLRERFLAREVIGFDSEPESLNHALGLGVIDSAKLEAGEWLRDVDLIVFAAPVRALPGLVASLTPFIGANTVLTDVGSVKTPLLESLSALPPELRARFIGGHPMAGSERGGVANASAALLQNAIWVLTPAPDSAPSAVSRVRLLVESVGAKPVVFDASAHDRLVATVSHLPYLSALALTRLIAPCSRRAVSAT
jgi:prephenate dehydrogenase